MCVSCDIRYGIKEKWKETECVGWCCCQLCRIEEAGESEGRCLMVGVFGSACNLYFWVCIAE